MKVCIQSCHNSWLLLKVTYRTFCVHFAKHSAPLSRQRREREIEAHNAQKTLMAALDWNANCAQLDRLLCGWSVWVSNLRKSTRANTKASPGVILHLCGAAWLSARCVCFARQLAANKEQHTFPIATWRSKGQNASSSGLSSSSWVAKWKSVPEGAEKFQLKSIWNFFCQQFPWATLRLKCIPLCGKKKFFGFSLTQLTRVALTNWHSAHSVGVSAARSLF